MRTDREVSSMGEDAEFECWWGSVIIEDPVMHEVARLAAHNAWQARGQTIDRLRAALEQIISAPANATLIAQQALKWTPAGSGA
jgi:hypothetical protein